MDQRGRLQSLARLLLGQLLRRQNTEFLIEQGQKFVRSFRVPPFDGIQDACDITYADSSPLLTSNRHILSQAQGNFKPHGDPVQFRQIYIKPLDL